MRARFLIRSAPWTNKNGSKAQLKGKYKIRDRYHPLKEDFIAKSIFIPFVILSLNRLVDKWWWPWMFYGSLQIIKYVSSTEFFYNEFVLWSQFLCICSRIIAETLLCLIKRGTHTFWESMPKKSLTRPWQRKIRYSEVQFPIVSYMQINRFTK